MNTPRLLLIFSLALNLAGVVRITLHQSAKDSTSIDRAVRESLFSEMRADHSIVFVGDSLTELCDWSELLGIPTLNRGIAGDTTADLLGRIHQIAQLHPDSVFLEIGTNDAAKGVTEKQFISNFRSIVNALRSDNPQATIYIESILPVRGNNRRIDGFNAQIRTLVGEHVIYLNVHDRMEENGELPQRYTVDGIHLTVAGYRVWQSVLAPLV